MQPKIIKIDTLRITGFTGDGMKTGELWNNFDSQYKNNPFPKADENGYEIRFWKSRVTGKTPDKGKDVHVGFSTDKAESFDCFTTIVLPAAEYAVFDVYVAKGYDSGNEEMEKWLADNMTMYRMLEFDGYEYVIECYNEKFKDGDKPDSIVEIWMPVEKMQAEICRSCSMPMTKPEDFSENRTYCCHCYEIDALRDGVTINKLITDVQKLMEIESMHPNLVSTPLLEYVENWLTLDDTAKATVIPSLLSVLIDGQDCDFTGTQWEKEWLADGKVCHCIACVAARKCISDIKLMGL